MPDSPAMTRRTWVSAIAMIAATYGYFLIFAQLAFIELVRGNVGEAGLRPVMGMLCVGGVAGSLGAAWRFRPAKYVATLRWSALACGAAAALACSQASYMAAGLIGLALGWLTVSLAAGLRSVVGLPRLGLVTGLGTGLGYALFNLPPLLHAAPLVQAYVGIGGMAVIVVATFGLKLGPLVLSVRKDYEPRRAMGWGAIFLVLVWIDSAMFYRIHHTGWLREGAWGSGWSLWVNAALHLIVATAVGLWLDQGRLGRVVLSAWAALALACVLLNDSLRFLGGAEVLYTVGVSLYMVALVYYPARSGRPWVAGGFLAVAGWLGSALGIGMAQDLQIVPGWFVILAGLVLARILRLRQNDRQGLRQPLLV